MTPDASRRPAREFLHMKFRGHGRRRKKELRPTGSVLRSSEFVLFLWPPFLSVFSFTFGGQPKVLQITRGMISIKMRLDELSSSTMA